MQAFIHIEPSADDPGGVIWWAEVPEVPGLYAAAASLGELKLRVVDALNDIDPTRLGLVDFHLAPEEPADGNNVPGLRVSGPDLRTELREDTAPGLSRSTATMLQPA